MIWREMILIAVDRFSQSGMASSVLDSRSAILYTNKQSYVLRVACCVLRVACCVLRVACCVLRVACCVTKSNIKFVCSSSGHDLFVCVCVFVHF